MDSTYDKDVNWNRASHPPTKDSEVNTVSVSNTICIFEGMCEHGASGQLPWNPEGSRLQTNIRIAYILNLQMWQLDHKEGWALKNWCFQTVVLEKPLERPLDCKEIQPVNPKGNQSWIFIRRTDAEAEALIFWPPDAKSQLIGKDLDAGKDWGQVGEGGNRGWDGWMASLTQWTWVWANYGRWWRTGKPGVL